MLGNNLRDFRKAASLTLDTLAKRVGCHKSTLSKIERCKFIPSASMMTRIAEAIGRPVARVFFQPDDEPVQCVKGVRNRKRYRSNARNCG